MPIYAYTCDKCNKSEDRLVRLSQKDSQICEDCQSEMHEEFPDQMNFILKGSWYKNNKSY